MIESRMFYWLTCDDCGRDLSDETEQVYRDASEAMSAATDNDWICPGDKHYCEGCRSKYDCSNCWEIKTECICNEEASK